MSERSGGSEAPQASTKWSCEHCRKEIPNAAQFAAINFCLFCGKEDTRWRCKHCHNEISNTQFPIVSIDFCPKCGKQQAEETETKKASSQQQSGNDQSSSESTSQKTETNTSGSVQSPDQIPTKFHTVTVSQESKQNTPDFPDPRDLSASGAARQHPGERKRRWSFSNKDSSTAAKNPNDSSEPAGPSNVKPFRSPQLKRRARAQYPETFANQFKSLRGTKRIQVRSRSPIISSSDSKRRKKSTENCPTLLSDKDDTIQLQRDGSQQAVNNNGSDPEGKDQQQRNDSQQAVNNNGSDPEGKDQQQRNDSQQAVGSDPDGKDQQQRDGSQQAVINKSSDPEGKDQQQRDGSHQAVINNGSDQKGKNSQQHIQGDTNQKQGIDQDSGNENQAIGSNDKQKSHGQGENDVSDSDQSRKV